jgi:hypothetical protein
MDQLIRNRREEEDEELMLFLFPVLYLISNRGREKRARHASILPGKERLKEILEGHEKNCLVGFCMEPRIFKDIATFLREEHILYDIRGVTVEENWERSFSCCPIMLVMRIYNMNSNIVVKLSTETSSQFSI